VAKKTNGKINLRVGFKEYMVFDDGRRGRGKNRRGRESIWVLVAMTTLG
jgi:hypothetical protein